MWREKQQKTTFVQIYENKRAAVNVELRCAVLSTPYSDNTVLEDTGKTNIDSCPVSLCRRWRLLLGWMRCESEVS